MDPMTVWTAIGVGVAILAQFGQYVHISNMMERRFTQLEAEVKYLRRDIDSLPRRRDDSKG